MALKLLQPGREPLGQYDVVDAQLTTFYGGEVVTFTSVVNTAATDKGAYDVFDGYVWSNKRVAVTRSIAADGYTPLMLADDGTTNYGTLFGSVVGGTVGQQVTGGTVLGPHTATGSGKLTLWDKPGLYAVSLDAACDQTATGLVPSNASLATGTRLTFGPSTSSTLAEKGLLTPFSSSLANSNTRLVGHFVDFDDGGSLVTTPNKLVSALGTESFTWAVFHFNPQY